MARPVPWDGEGPQLRTGCLGSLVVMSLSSAVKAFVWETARVLNKRFLMLSWGGPAILSSHSGNWESVGDRDEAGFTSCLFLEVPFHQKPSRFSLVWWCMPTIPAFWEAKAEGLQAWV